jgi:hypothetical protein
MRRGTLPDVSSTDNPGPGAQQATPPIAENEDASTPEAVSTEEPTSEATSPEAVTPDAGTPAAPSPVDAALADPTVDATGSTAGPAADQAPPSGRHAAPDPEPAAALPEVPTAGGRHEAAAPEPVIPEAAPAEGVTTPAAPEPASEPVAPDAVTPEPATEVVAPKPVPRPMPPRPAPSPAPAAAPAAPVEVPAAEVSDPSEWGRVDEDGTVYVRTAEGERAVGSWQAGEPTAGLAHYGRRYDDLATEVALLEARLKAHTGNPAEIKNKAQVGTADSAAAESRAEKAAARSAQIARKEALAAEAEQIGAESTAWKAAGDRLKAIVEEWKTIRGIDRKTDEALWTRFAAARDAFGRRRGAHFASLDAQRGEARSAKQELIKEAQKLATSTDWGPTSAAMRSLMDRWKAVPRTGRDGDDDLWKEFRAAQDVFFAARSESDKKRTGEEQANQQLKEELLAEAERLDPTSDLRGAQNALRKIQDRYDAIGHVPRGVMRSLEDRMQAVEQKVRGASDSSRARTAPENPMVTSMRAAVSKAEEQLAKAEAAGDQRRIEEAQANLVTRREWLAEAEKSASRR